MDQGTLLETFITEATELIQELEIDVVALEDSKDDEELINRIFRAAHTIKGSGGLVGLTAISDFTHSMESVLDLVRQRELAVTGELVSVLLRAVDLLKAMIKSATMSESCFEQRELEFVLELLGQFLPDREECANTEKPRSTNKHQEDSYFEIELKLSENLLETGTDPLMLFRELRDIGEIVDIVPDARSLPDVYNVDAHKLYLNWRLVLRTSEPFSSIENVFIFVQDDSEISITDVSCHFKDGVDLRVADMRLGEILAENGLVISGDIEEALSSQTRIGELLVQSGKVKEEDVKCALDKQLKSREVQKATTIRVDTDKLDKLVNLVGEMVIAVARTVQQSVYEDREGKRTTHDALDMLQRITGDLQEQVMRVRMIPVEGLFSRFHRVIRDLATAEGKHVRLILSGTETELDKNVIEQMSDPLKHLIRNSVDHGVELPGKRRKAGKPEEAVVKLSAYQQEGNIIIEVLDDGQGIDPNAIVDKAVEKGLINRGDNLDEREIYQLMFMPGFSTAKEVTEVSGRGVGLDVVKRNIDDLKGSIVVLSEIGKGTTFRIKLPLTLAIIDGMNVKVGDEAFIIPLMAIVESIRPNREAVKTVEGTGEVIDARGEYLPLVRLHNVFDIKTDKTKPSEALVVIVESSQRRFGILVDDVIGQQQAVVKSLEKNFRQVEGAAGATILGDGSISLILDIHGLEKMAFTSFKSIQASGLDGEAA
jgi:two-component system chemotaxis sensor kinase CheA